MPPYVPNVPAWTDETGVGDGTLFTAARMNHIEDGVEELSDEIASLSGGGGILDGGTPSTNYAGLPVIDCGGVT